MFPSDKWDYLWFLSSRLGRAAKKPTFYQTNELAEHTQAFELSLQTTFREKTRQLKGEESLTCLLAGENFISIAFAFWNADSIYETRGLTLCSDSNSGCNFLKQQASGFKPLKMEFTKLVYEPACQKGVLLPIWKLTLKFPIAQLMIIFLGKTCFDRALSAGLQFYRRRGQLFAEGK